MTLADVTRDSVLKAIGECDELGQEQFLAKHGFAPARLYKIQYEEREYDSKAIVGVAHGYATGKVLDAAHFSGGQATVVRTLEALGFAFASTQKSNTAPRRAWLVMTKTEYRRLGGGESTTMTLLATTAGTATSPTRVKYRPVTSSSSGIR
ncbi:hypothetical protein ACQGFJ_00630 [Rhodococcus sp. 3.70]